MRLGGVAIHPGSREALTEFASLADSQGVSAIVAPAGMDRMSADEACAWGEAIRDAGLVIGEAGFWENLLTQDDALRADRRQRLRITLRNADLMGCRSVAMLPGAHHPSDKAFAAEPLMRSPERRAAVLETVRFALDGFNSATTRLGMEPYAASFFYTPEAVLDFIAEVDDPRFGVHLDLANMLTVETFFECSKVIAKWLPALAPHVVSCHLKDLEWPVSPLGLAFREVDLGQGVMDLPGYLRAIDTGLDPDMTVFCEHYATAEDYFRNFATAHAIAADHGLAFLRRTGSKGDPR